MQVQDSSPDPAAATAAQGCEFELRFEHLFHTGRARAFPCDASGSVSEAALTEAVRRHFLQTRASVGREFAMPVVARRFA